MNFRIWASFSFLKKCIFELNCSLFFLKLTSLFLKIFKNLTSQKSVPYKAFLIKHNVCIVDTGPSLGFFRTGGTIEQLGEVGDGIC